MAIINLIRIISDIRPGTVRNTYNVDLTQHLQMYKAHASDSAKGTSAILDQ